MKTPFAITHPLLRLQLACLIAALGGASSYAALPSHGISAGNVTVVQNDALNNTNSINTFVSLSINDFRVRGNGATNPTDIAIPQQSRGDFCVQIGSTAAGNATN